MERLLKIVVCCEFGPKRGIKIKILNVIEFEKDKMDISRMYSRMKTSRMCFKKIENVESQLKNIENGFKNVENGC